MPLNSKMIKIREATTKDISLIVSFQLKMAMESEEMLLDKAILENGVNAVFEDQNKGRYYVAGFENQIVGSMLNTYEWSDWRNGIIIWFQSVYVMPEYRKNGIFKNMYQHIKNIVEKNDQYKGMRLYVDVGNLKAQKVYADMGMVGDHYFTYEWMK